MSDSPPLRTESTRELPSFRKPPVIEAVLGVQFHPLPGLTNGHLGAFWKHLQAAAQSDGERWDCPSDASTIEPAFERFEEERSWSRPPATLRLTQDPSCRLQIRNTTADAMVQVQNGRLHYNWIGRGGQDYPRYGFVRPAFDQVYAGFRQFLSGENLGPISPNQWEVTYVNHIPRGSVWNDPTDWAKLFNGLIGSARRITEVRLESLAGAWHFEIPEKRGRLHVDLKHAKLTDTVTNEVLRLTLTARGPIDQKACLSEGLDLGRRVIVLTFWDITSKEAHDFWESKQ